MSFLTFRCLFYIPKIFRKPLFLNHTPHLSIFISICMENDPKLLECQIKLITKFTVLLLYIFIEALLLSTMFTKAQRRKNYGNLQCIYRIIFKEFHPIIK